MARGTPSLPPIPSLIVAFCALLALAVAAYAARAVDPRIGLAGVIVVLATSPIAVAILWAGQRRAGGSEAAPDDLAGPIRTISEQVSLSADARRILARSADRAVLRQAIEGDIAAADWDAAMVLVKELADRFGYRREAEEYRQRIERARSETLERDVAEAIARLDALIAEKRWDLALEDAARIGRLYPDSPKIEGLRERVAAAREAHKADLERRFFLAAREDCPTEAMDLLKQLDAFLTEVEAEPYRELARGVIGRARENLGAEFKLAVQDRRWRHAAEVGARIIEEFPNSRMAAEVRQVIDSIRERAGALRT